MAASKAYIVNSSWVLVGSNITEIFIYANKQYDLDLFIGQSAPNAATKDYVQIESTENFGASALSTSDLIYVRCANPIDITLRILTV